MSALDKKISQLNQATSLSPGDFFAVVQSGETKKVDFADLFTSQPANFATFQQAISDGTLIPGSIYYLTDVQNTLAETITAKILVQAVDVNKINPNAIRLQLVPNYSTLSIWSSGGSYSIGNKVIWGSRVWTNLTGVTGSAPDALTLDGANWDEVSYVAGVNYTEIPIPCVYDILNDLITCQEHNGIKVCTSLNSVVNLGWSACDFSDWGQTFNDCFKVELFAIGFLNNPNLSIFTNVTAVGVVNNLCVSIANCQANTDKITTAGGDASISENECQDIANITNFTSIKNIPSSVTSYKWVTDDETGYIEFDLDNYPLLIGTYVIGCITDIDKAICEVTMNCDGALPGTTLTFGIDTDDPTHVTMTGANINTAPQRDTTISARTTAYNRELILDVSVADADSGKLWITYKYI
jgi:hypothetical protein